MISKSERKRLKKILGNRYTNAVLKQLNAQGVVNENGKPYSANMIRVVFNGYRNHAIIEEAIYQAAELAKQQAKKEQAKRKRILKSA